MIDQLKEVLVEILHTRDGSRVTLQCLWHGSAKVRQNLLEHSSFTTALSHSVMILVEPVFPQKGGRGPFLPCSHSIS